MISSRMTVTDHFYGLFEWRQRAFVVTEGDAKGSVRTVPCPQTGRPLKVASREVSDRGVCPACAQLGTGGYVTFVSDLRLAFACPTCRKLVWIAGA